MRRAFVIALLAAAAACARFTAPRAATPTTDPVRLQEFLDSRRDAGIPEDPAIGPGDVIRIKVRDLEEASRDYTVSRKGTIRLPFVGEAKVGEKSVKAAGEEISKRLESVVVEPSVRVERVGAAGSQITVEGAVERPSKVSLGRKGKTLLEALAATGGLSSDATGVIRITPAPEAPSGLFAEGTPNGFDESTVEIAASDVLRADGPVRLYLRPGDRIHVVSKNPAAVAAVPDPLVELGMPEADIAGEDVELAADEEREQPPRKRAPSRALARGDEIASAIVATEDAKEITEDPVRESPKRRSEEPVVEQPVEVPPAPRPPRAQVAAVEPARADSAKLREELESLRRRVEANETDLRSQVRRAEDEAAKRQSELAAARAEAEAAKQREAAERRRATELTRRVIQLESVRGGPVSAAEANDGGETETIVLRQEAAPSEATETSGSGRRSGGIFGWLRGGSRGEEAAAPPPAATRAIAPPANEPPPPSAAVYAPPPDRAGRAAAVAAPRENVRPPAPKERPSGVSAAPRSEPPSPPPSRSSGPAVVARASSAAPARPARAGVDVSGRVKVPGNQSLAEARTITRALARAGLAPDADISRIEVRRGGERWRILVNLREVRSGRSPDLMLEDGDTILVP